MILGFYGNYWNENGVLYKGYAFKNLTKEEALGLLNKISETIEANADYLSEDQDINNLYFQYEDLLFLVYMPSELHTTRIRVIWKSFDAEWEISTFSRTKKRFEKRIN